MSIDTIPLERCLLTRIGFRDVPVPAQVLGIAPEAVAALPWSAPTWASGNQPRLGAAAWFADFDGCRIVFDPLGALDVLLRPDLDTELANELAVVHLFADSGFPVESVDLVVVSHIDGVGMVARRDVDAGWTPFFPNARILLSDVELAGLRAADAAGEDTAPDLARGAWMALVKQGCVDSYADGAEIVSGLTADISGGHGPGHAVMHFGDARSPALTFIGHLAVTPVQLATGECAALNEDPAAAWTLLHRYAGDGRLIAGSLWPTPGWGRWRGEALHVAP